MRSALLVAAVVALVAAAAALFWAWLGWFGAWRLNRAAPPGGPTATFTFTPWELEVEHESVALAAADGVALQGWFLPRPATPRAVVVMHGYRGDKSQVLGVSSYLWRQGFNVLLFDIRGRGMSGSAPISMGLWEAADLAAALDWVGARVAAARIGLMGYSMGGVVALMGGADPRVQAIVTDSAFTSQRELLEHIAIRDTRAYLRGVVDGRRLVPAVEWWHRRQGKPPFDAIVPLAAAERLDGKPLLIIHGTRDRVVPVEHAERLAAVVAGSETWLVSGALHCGAYFVDRVSYCARVADFFARNLDAPLAARGLPGDG